MPSHTEDKGSATKRKINENPNTTNISLLSASRVVGFEGTGQKETSVLTTEYTLIQLLGLFRFTMPRALLVLEKLELSQISVYTFFGNMVKLSA